MILFSFQDYFPGWEPFIAWCAGTWIGTYIHSATWAFKFIETLHILAWVVLLGTTTLVNLRLIGLLRGWTAELIADTVARFVNLSLLAVVVTGVLMFLSDPWKYYSNDAFAPKMLFLGVVVIYQFAVYPRVVQSRSRVWPRVAALASFVTWFYVGAAGRAIAAV